MIPTTDALETYRCLHMSHLINSTQTSCYSVQLSTTYQQTSLISDLSLPHNVADKVLAIEHLSPMRLCRSSAYDLFQAMLHTSMFNSRHQIILIPFNS